MPVMVDGATKHAAAPPLIPAGLRVHLIGIGGSGMSGAAALLMQQGAVVSGSDRTPFEAMGRLVELGAQVSIGHDRAALRPDCDLVVMSAAVPESNPELRAARERGLRVIKYAELLGLLMSSRCGVAVSGTHGKSTTTALTAFILRESGLDPSFVVGAQSDQLGGSSGVGAGPHFVVEACEFDRSFLHLRPRAAAILNIESDHLDCYGDLPAIVEAFGQFAGQVAPDGYLVCHAGAAAAIAARSCASLETFGLDKHADWQADFLCERTEGFAFDVLHRGKRLMRTRLAIPGMHNVENALAAIALAHHAGAAPQAIAEAVPRYAGVRRRMTLRGEADGVTIVDDYAHHPTEIRATLAAARQRFRPVRVWVVFQPHQRERTRRLMDEFAGCFGGADEIMVLEVYGARECASNATDEENDSRELAARIQRQGGKGRFVSGMPLAAEEVIRGVGVGDLILTMGAGDVWKVADELVERICGQHAVRRAAWANDLVSPGRAGAVAMPAA